jgi:arylsulfatase A
MVRIFRIVASVLLASSAQAAKPNIVLIVADDLGYGDLSCFGCEDIATPHIDSIAKQGVRFTNAYAYPTCSPTRASLMTGQYAERFGISAALMGEDSPKFQQAITIAQVLKQSGYATGLVGKWHLGYTDDVSPTRKGFDEFFGFRGGKIDFFKHTDTAQKVEGNPDGKHDLWEGEQPVTREGYTTDLFTARARQFIRHRTGASDGKPFFLYLAYNAPHYARKGVWQAPDEYLKRFNALGKTQGRDVYRAMVACLDDGVGEILAELDSQAVADDTLVIFMSDNGGEPPGSNKPLSGGKHGFKEGGVRVPWLARWPGNIAPGFVRDDVVHAIDVMPTLLAVAGATAPKNVTFDGRNVWSAFIGGEPVPDRSIYFSNRGLRYRNWKLLNGQLFDLQADPQELSDVAAAHPDLVQQFTAKSTQWAKAIGIAK